MIQLNEADLISALQESNCALRSLVKQQAASVQALGDDIWYLRQQVFALQYPELWQRLTANPERVETLGITFLVQ